MTVKLILPWVGELPWYWPLFEDSTKNAGIELVVVRGDCEYFRKRVERALPEAGSCGLTDGYKLCDLKPMYGRIFADEIGDADYWALGDCDIVYGRSMRGWIERMMADGVDVFCVRRDWPSGPFTLMKNSDKVNSLFERTAIWRDVVRSPVHCGFDELGHNWLTRHRYGGVSYDELRREGNFAGVLWNATDIKFVHEDVLCEDGLVHGRVVMHPDGRLMLNDAEIAAFHFIAAKSAIGFSTRKKTENHRSGYLITRDGYWGCAEPSKFESLSRRILGLADFGIRFIRGDSAARLRTKRVVLRTLGHKEWWRYA